MIRLTMLAMFVFFSFQISFADSTQVLIVYYSKTGNTKTMAENVARGAREIDSTSVKLLSVENVKAVDIANADAIIVGTPVYSANVSPQMQEFINSWPFDGSMKNKVGAAFVSAGGISTGEELTQLNVLHSMLVYGMIVVGGESWQSAFGASAIVSEEPFNTHNDPEKINLIFIKKAMELGARVAQIARKISGL
jgi:NAD(P)H dehydrogenase (quinone)